MEKKCARLHIGKNTCINCPEIFVNKKPIKYSEKEKYLGDYLTKFANPMATMGDRRQKGEGILSNIRAILEDVPLGKRRLETGLTLREAWFLNETLYNSEVWCSYKETNLKVLEVLDRKILRSIVGTHSKVPWKVLYLETSVLPISSVITARRLLNLQTILKRSTKEIIRKVYEAQKSSPIKGDWINLVREDMKQIGIDISDKAIEEMSQEEYKIIVRKAVKNMLLKNLSPYKRDTRRLNI